MKEVSVKEAIAKHDVESLKELLKDESPQHRGKALYLAVDDGEKNLRSLYYYENTDAGYFNNFYQKRAENEGAIEIAKSKTKELVKVILDLGADVNVIEAKHNYWTPFTYACHFSTADIVKMMMEHGANLELDIQDGGTPIKNAFFSGDKEIIDLFFDKVNAENVNQWELLNAYVQNSNAEEEIMTKLLQFGADVNKVDVEGRPVLFCAIHNKNLDCLEFLIKAGADVNETGSYLWSLLHLAIVNLLMDSVRVLLKHGADPNLGSYNLIREALSCCYEKNSHGIIELLLSYGADINKRGDKSSPLSFAVELGHEEVCKFLIRKIILMKAQGLYVSDENLHASDTKEQFRQYQNECVKEMELSKEEKFKDTSLSYFDIFEIKNVRKLASLARNENIVQVLKSDDFNKEFPIYGNLIVVHFDKGILENKDFELLKRFVNYLSTRDHDRLPKLPFTFVCDWFTYLNWEDFNALWEI